MADFPALTWDTLEGWPTQFEDWYNDHLPFRDDLIRLDSAMKYYGLHMSPNDEVIPGEGEWLFYNKRSDGNPMGTYQGGQRFTEAQMAQVAANMTAYRDDLAAMGIDFYLFITPNKATVYGDKVSRWVGTPAEVSPTDEVVTYLQEYTDLQVVWCAEELRQARAASP